MTDGVYIGPQPVAPFPEDVIRSQNHALTFGDEIEGYIQGLKGELKRIFLVGAGGSLLGLVPAQYILDKYATTPAVSLNSDEFYYRAPAGVGSDSLVILLSGKGMTPETVRAGKWAQSRGASVAAVTLNGESPLAASVKRAFVAKTGHGSQILLQLVALALLRREGYDAGPMHAALRSLPAALLASLVAYEPNVRDIAHIMKDVAVTNVIASGPLFGAASTFTMCYLQEMLWMQAATLNADEFFQGPFETVDKDSKIIVFLGEDDTRPMGERVIRFLEAYAGPMVCVDGKHFPLPGIDRAQRGYVLPLVFHGLVARLAAHYSAVRGYALEGRRYMWKVDY